MAAKRSVKTATKTSKKAANVVSSPSSNIRSRVSQSDVPTCSLEKALTVPAAIIKEYGNGPATPVELGSALNQSPTSSSFKALTGAAIAYGLTVGGYNAASIGLTDLAKRILKPKEEGDDLTGKREALLKPTIIKSFLSKYDGHALPRRDIGNHVLESLGVPSDRAEAVQSLIIEGAQAVSLITKVKEQSYVQLAGAKRAASVAAIPGEEMDFDDDGEEIDHGQGSTAIPAALIPVQQPIDDPRLRRVFVTHGKNKAFVEPIKQLLGFGEMHAVVSVERESVSQPVPDKVMSDMRSCGAAIIHVEDELRLMDKDAKEHIVLNENVLMEIGAAFALYGRRFVLLVKEGVKLPSNTQGLYEVRYQGDSLSGDTTIKLLKAIQDIKNHALPSAT